VARDIAAALRSAVAETPESYNRVLDQQIEATRGRGGELDVEALLKQVSAHYDRLDAERRGVVLSMQLMSDEAQALTREIREETASHLQAILDNVKDAIVTVDDVGRIETFNPTGERLFGYSAAEVLGRTLDFLLPDAGTGRAGDAPRRPLVEFLERCATKIDDTHVDLAAHQTWGTTKDRVRVVVEVAVSKASLNRRDGYIVCIRDSTERHLAEVSMRESEARDIAERKRADAIAAGERRVFEKIAANAPLSAVLEAISEVIERVIPNSFCAINLLDHEGQVLRFGAAPSLPREFVAAMDLAPIGLQFGSCSAAVFLARQVTVPDIEADALWEFRRDVAKQAGLRAAWSAPIVASDGVIVGTFSAYQPQPGVPPPALLAPRSGVHRVRQTAVQARARKPGR